RDRRLVLLVLREGRRGTSNRYTRIAGCLAQRSCRHDERENGRDRDRRKLGHPCSPHTHPAGFSLSASLITSGCAPQLSNMEALRSSWVRHDVTRRGLLLFAAMSVIWGIPYL